MRHLAALGTGTCRDAHGDSRYRHGIMYDGTEKAEARRLWQSQLDREACAAESSDPHDIRILD